MKVYELMQENKVIREDVSGKLFEGSRERLQFIDTPQSVPLLAARPALAARAAPAAENPTR